MSKISDLRMECKKENFLGFKTLTKKHSKHFLSLREEQGLNDLKENREFLEPKTLKKPSLRKRRQGSFNDDSFSVVSLNAGILKSEKKKRRLSRMSSLTALLSPAKQIKKVGGMLTRARSTIHLVGESFDAGPPSSPFEHGPLVRSPSCDNVSRRKPHISTTGSHTDLDSCDQTSVGHVPDLPSPLVSSSTSSLNSRQGSLRKKPRPTGSIKRGRQWIEKFKEDKRAEVLAQLSYWELKRQEALYELYKGEKYLVQDLDMLDRAYRSGLECLKILKPQEAEMVFGPIGALLPLHRRLRDELKQQRDCGTKTIQKVGKILWEWVKDLENKYVPYCCSQTGSKDLLDSRKAKCSQMRDFLNRCQESDFSRKLDLWNFLDVPRSKLMKYPLLLKSILKQTPEGHEDKDYLPKVIDKVEEVIRTVDQKTGESNCQYVLKKLEFTDGRQKEPFLYQARTILCQGELKNNRGTKLYGFLFDTGFVLTRSVEREDGSICYKAHKHPISAHTVTFSDCKDTDSSRSGSFKSTFTYNPPAHSRNVFQVSSTDERDAFILTASNEHDKLEWLQRLRDVKAGVQVRRYTYDTRYTYETSPLVHSSPVLRRHEQVENSPPSTPMQSSTEESEGSVSGTATGGLGSAAKSKSILKSKNWSFGGSKTPLRRTSFGKLTRRKSIESSGSFGSDENICPSVSSGADSGVNPSSGHSDV